jgi:hypothetical protein
LLYNINMPKTLDSQVMGVFISVYAMSLGVHIFVYAARLTHIYNLNLGCLHTVAYVRSGDGFFYIRLCNITLCRRI